MKEIFFRESVDTNAYTSGIGFENYAPKPDSTDKYIKGDEITTNIVSLVGKKPRKPHVPYNCGGSEVYYKQNSKY